MNRYIAVCSTACLLLGCSPPDAPQGSSTPAEETDSRAGDGGAGAKGDAATEDASVSRLVGSLPAAGAANVYPSPFGDGSRFQFDVSLDFSEPVDPTRTRVNFGRRGESGNAYDVTWASPTSAHFSVLPPPLAPQILRENTTYVVDYSPLLSTSVGGQFTFTTGAYDPLLNHTCGHTVFGPFGAGVAAALDAAATFSLSATHTQYAVTLGPIEETFGGSVSLVLPLSGPYRLYFDRAVVASHVSGVERKRLTIDETPKSCPGISHFGDVDLSDSPSTLLLEQVAEQTVHVIVESLAE